MADEVQKIYPKNNPFLLGQDTAEQIFLRSWKENTLHHAWILYGSQGCGKATLAYRIAKFLFWANEANKDKYSTLNVPENDVVFKQVADGSYPDLKVLERSWTDTERRKVIKAIQSGEPLDDEELSGLKKSAYIRIDEVREAVEFLSKTSYNNGWRIVIIDSVDDMNKNSANALLKILEEPPAKTVLLLICHNIGRVLPTIRSRCAKLPLRNLQSEEVASLLRRYRPHLEETEISELSELSSGSIGKAVIYADKNVLAINRHLSGILNAEVSLRDMLDFCAQASKDDETFMMLEDLLSHYFKQKIRHSENVNEVYECWQQSAKMFADCADINMDKNLMLINLLQKAVKLK